MSLNIDKCQVLSICHGKSSKVTFDYGLRTVNNSFTKLNHVSVIKDLGVFVDSDLNFSTHISEKITMAFKMLGVIRHSFVNIDKSTFSLLYKVQ